MRRRLRKGQSILEYTLLLGVVISVVVAVFFGNNIPYTTEDGETMVTSIKGIIETAYIKFGTALSNTIQDLTAGVFSPVKGAQTKKKMIKQIRWEGD